MQQSAYHEGVVGELVVVEVPDLGDPVGAVNHPSHPQAPAVQYVRVQYVTLRYVTAQCVEVQFVTV
jgi:hypothetical protein